jgi:hypothetical protein
MPKFRRKLGHVRKEQNEETMETFSNSHNFKSPASRPTQLAVVDRAVKYAEAREDELAQHGPVRVLWRNGKPVSSSPR